MVDHRNEDIYWEVVYVSILSKYTGPHHWGGSGPVTVNNEFKKF